MTRSFAAYAHHSTDAPLFGGVINFGRALIIVLFLTVSPLALVMYDWQYLDAGGSPIDKFHPSTLLAGALVVLMAFSNRNPLTGLIDVLSKNRDMLPFLGANLFMLLYTNVIFGLPVTLFIETFVGGILMMMLYRNLDESHARTLALLIHAFMFLNAVVAFYEIFSGTRLTPLVVNGEILFDEPRATALLGHPLANAILAGSYIVMLALGGGRDLPAILRPVAFVVALASLAPFGGRAATLFAILILLYIAGRQVWRAFRGAPFNNSSILSALIVIPLAGLALVAAYEVGALDTLTNRLFDDEGSAGSRIEMFALFQYLTVYDLIFGPNPAMLMTRIRLHGLEYGLESFVIAFILNYGLLCALVFFPAFALFFYRLADSTRRRSGLAVLYFLLVALTSISLSSKSPTLSIFTLQMLVLLRPDDTELERKAA